MTKRNKHKNAWKFWTAILISMCIPLVLAHFYGLWRVDASELIDPSPYKTIQLPTPTPDKNPELPADVVETIKWAFKDKGERVVKEALLVARCESGLRAEAFNGKNTNGSTDSGVFQINSVHGVPQKFLKDYRVNVMIAKKIYEDWGNSWGAWVCAKKVGVK